jgi:hypothetical protein
MAKGVIFVHCPNVLVIVLLRSISSCWSGTRAKALVGYEDACCCFPRKTTAASVLGSAGWFLHQGESLGLLLQVDLPTPPLPLPCTRQDSSVDRCGSIRVSPSSFRSATPKKKKQIAGVCCLQCKTYLSVPTGTKSMQVCKSKYIHADTRWLGIVVCGMHARLLYGDGWPTCGHSTCRITAQLASPTQTCGTPAKGPLGEGLAK